MIEVEDTRLTLFGLQVEDEPGNPSIAFAPLREQRDVDELVEALGKPEISLHFFNELGMNLLRFDCALPRVATGVQEQLAELAPTLVELSSVPRTVIEAVKDTFESLHFSGSTSATGARVHLNETLLLSVQDVSEFEVTHMGAGTFHLSDEDEGGELERLVLPLFEWLCPTQAYLRPEVLKGEKRRELMDLLAFTPSPEFEHEGYFLVESKALSVTSAKPKKSSTKRAKSVQKDIEKAIKQIKGAAKNVRARLPLLDEGGDPIEMNGRSQQVGHGIVLLSELHQGVNWPKVADLVKAAAAVRVLVHVLDLSELQRLVSGSEGRPAMFEYFLLQRWHALQERRSLIRQVIGPPTDPAPDPAP